MSVSTEQYNQLLVRMTRVENALNDLITAVGHFMTQDQITQVFTVIQTELADIGETVTALETRVQDIENEPIT